MSVKDIDMGYQLILDNIAEVNSKEAVTGYFQDDIEDGIGLAQLMATHEFGATIQKDNGDTVVIPERPAMRMSADTNQEDIVNNMFAVGDKMIFENLGIDLGYTVIGDFYKSEFQNGIASRSLGLAENAPRTIAKKGSDTPLVDTAILINGINTKVEEV